MPQQHPLERRASLLAGRITQRIGDISQSLTAAQGRIPFHEKLSQARALDWWSQHRYDPLGQKALAGLAPLAIQQLDTELTRYTQQQDAAGAMQPREGANAQLA